MVWADAPKTMELGIIDMFLSHLRAEKAPASTRVPRKWQIDADFAHLSLLGLGGMQAFADDPRYQAQSRAVAAAWPGVFKWCSYIYDARVASESAQDRRIFLDSLVKVLYMLSCFNVFLKAMLGTAGCLELVTKLWMLEDIPAGVESIILGPIPTATLGMMMKTGAALGKTDMYKRLIKAAGGDSDFVVQLLLGRVKKATKAMNSDLGALGLSWHIDLISDLCEPTPYPLRRGFFDSDVITMVTSAFVVLSRRIVQDPTPNNIMMLASCINFFSTYLEGDDYLSLVHAVKAGFLPAYLDCSPVFSSMPDDTIEAALDIFRQVLPRYLVYRSFIEAVRSATLRFAPVRLNTPHYEALIAQPIIQSVWRSFIALFVKRASLLEEAYQLKNEGAPVRCDYIKCQRVDVKSNFKKCSACQVVHYCSPECQRLAWKSSHRTACKQIKAEYSGHRDKGRPKTDIEFLHGLANSEADINFAVFHDLAEKQFPDVPHADLMPCIDFSKVPQSYSVKVIQPGASGHPGVFFSAADAAVGEARFQEMVTKVRGSGTTIVQSIIASGATIEILTTPMERKNFWEDKNTYSSGSDDEVSSSGTDSESDEDEESGDGSGSIDSID
ncbi:hypothetical protein C8R44DRAFT_889470 [Mycena epipterygia]|nr:hypothetical protein C8R44DRAFT_889470 [Mycena epipterygia]